ncbi:Glycosyl hydrolases family 25 [Amycolatopsis arida]|uniref:Glycosyl hydrolases family 25 n=1 Tax=Amycolatopsis arida TaxID=587909 RepID=A0A1I5Q4U1_9PSEU|nr:GH25 family lysozyme [Amycolatopsis arida]TDX98710.1 glycosyl hydrolase family 25 [Amycolatopsis arida]SFP40981.1 Glycosyl hydrolases family 25 [Amycolatopsis arida]
MSLEDPARGINLAHAEIVDDWTAVRASGAVFASVTVTESLNWTDSAAVRQLRAAQGLGLHCGARHLARPGGASNQAEHFVRTTAPLGTFAPGALAPALDVRVPGVDDRFVRGWIKAVRQAAGVGTVLVYAEYEDWLHRLRPDKWADAGVVLWLVRHNGIPGRPGWFHSRLGLHEHHPGHDALVYPFTLADILL